MDVMKQAQGLHSGSAQGESMQVGWNGGQGTISREM